MTRPNIVVNVVAALQRRGAPTDTGVAFMVFAGATGSTDPVECYSKADATGSGAPDPVAEYVRVALTQGAPKVVLTRATAVDAAAVTQTEWTTALDKLTAEYGPGQVLIPGVTDTAAHTALLDHASTMNRCALLDTAKDATAAAIVTVAAALAAGAGADKAGLFAGWPIVPGMGGTALECPPSVVVAGLVGRNDAAVGHANNAPAGDQSRGAGFVQSAIGITTAWTEAELDSFEAAGVTPFKTLHGQVQLYDWLSVSTAPEFKQLGWGRMAMQLAWGLEALAEAFLFRQIDGQGLLFAELEGAQRGYLAPLYAKGALYGAEADDAFDVEVQGENTPTTIAAGDLRSAVVVSLSAAARHITINVSTKISEAVSA